MGSYLSTPKREKSVEDGGGFRFGRCVEEEGEPHTCYGVASMQGWRQTMEDAHIACRLLSETRGFGLYGVFDGHGGSTVSIWVAQNLLQMLDEKLCEYEKKGDYAGQMSAFSNRQQLLSTAIRQSFFDLDDRLRIPDTEEDLRKIANSSGEKQTDLQKAQTLVELLIKGGRYIRLVNGENQQQYKATEEKPKDIASLNSPEGNDEGESGRSSEAEETGESSDKWSDGEGECEEGEKGNTDWSSSSTAFAMQRVRGPSGLSGPTIVRTLAAGGTREGAKESESPQGGSFAGHPSICGATAVVAIVDYMEPPTIVVANTGDSRAVLCRYGVAIPMSRDHKPDLECETARIDAAGGYITNGRVEGNLNLSRSLGDLCYKADTSLPPQRQKITSEPEIRIIPIATTDEFLVIACDGIWECKSNQEVVDFVRARINTGLSLSSIAGQLCDACLSKSPLESEGLGCDNMTVLIVAIGDSVKKTEPKNSKRLLFGEVPVEEPETVFADDVPRETTKGANRGSTPSLVRSIRPNSLGGTDAKGTPNETRCDDTAGEVSTATAPADAPVTDRGSCDGKKTYSTTQFLAEFN